MKIGALIPARIGSKRLPKKNIIDLGGKPLVCWTIDPLLEAGFFNDITVSTESEEVAETVRSKYSEKDVKILMRPEELAQDDSPLPMVEAHYLQKRPDINWYGLFMPTMPFRKPAVLKEMYEAILSGYPWKSQSYTSEVFPTLDYYYPDESGNMKRFFSDPMFYCRAFSCTYMLNHRNAHPDLWRQNGLSHMDRTHIVHISKKECVDIDTPEDLRIAQHYVEGFKPEQKLLKSVQKSGWTICAPEGSDFEGLFEYLGDLLDDNENPILVLEEAVPKLTFINLADGAQRRPWISPEAAGYLVSELVNKTANMRYMKKHYFHVRHCRIKRTPDEYAPMILSDTLGGIHGMDGSAVPAKRVFMAEDLTSKKLLASPFNWVKEL